MFKEAILGIRLTGNKYLLLFNTEPTYISTINVRNPHLVGELITLYYGTCRAGILPIYISFPMIFRYIAGYFPKNGRKFIKI